MAVLHTIDSATTLLSTRALLRAETIDGGDTVVLHMRCADGASLSVLMPREAARAVRAAIDLELAAPVSQTRIEVAACALGSASPTEDAYAGA